MEDEYSRIEKKARELYPIKPRKFVIEMEVFKLAWEDGHSGGETEILSHYCDLAGLVQLSIDAVLTSNSSPTS